MRIRILLLLLAAASGALLALPHAARGDAHAPRVQAQAGDLTLYVRTIQRSQYVSRQFTPDGMLDSPGYYGVPHCYVTLGFEGARPGDRYRVAGLNPSGDASDDRGDPVTVWSQVNPSEGEGGVTALLTLPDLSGNAKYIASLDGTLSLFARADPIRVEVPWPAPGQRSTGSQGDISVVVSEARKLEDGVSFSLRLDSPERALPEWNLSPRGGAIALLDANGKTIATDSMRAFASGGGSGYRTYRLVCSGVPDAPARIAATIVVRSGPISSVPFHMERIPLPDFLRMPVSAPRSRAQIADTGSLLTRVTMGGQPAGVGTLVIGLRSAGKPSAGAPPAPAIGGSSSWFWAEVPTDAAGAARVERVKPGRYLVRRYWRPAAAAVMPDPFAWRNALAQVEVAPKQESALPPLALDASPRR